MVFHYSVQYIWPTIKITALVSCLLEIWKKKKRKNVAYNLYLARFNRFSECIKLLLHRDRRILSSWIIFNFSKHGDVPVKDTRYKPLTHEAIYLFKEKYNTVYYTTPAITIDNTNKTTYKPIRPVNLIKINIISLQAQ